MTGLVPEVGCWVDGHWGQYASARLVELAVLFGYDDIRIAELASQRMNECAHGGISTTIRGPLSDEEAEELIEGAERAIDWLNEHTAPEGTSFGWHDGEVFLQTEEWWEEE